MTPYKKAKKLVHIALGSKCSKCGNVDFRCLEVDHIDAELNPNRGRPETGHRSSGIVQAYKMLGSGADLKEIFQLLCANCHAIKTIEEKDYLVKERLECERSYIQAQLGFGF